MKKVKYGYEQLKVKFAKTPCITIFFFLLFVFGIFSCKHKAEEGSKPKSITIVNKSKVKLPDTVFNSITGIVDGHNYR